MNIPANSLDFITNRATKYAHIPDDKIFITCRGAFDYSANCLTIRIDETCPIVGKLDGLLSLSQAGEKGALPQGVSMLAAGSFLFVNGKVALLQRDAGAPRLALHWTNASGMAGGEHPFTTADKEASEELALQLANGNILRFTTPSVEIDNRHIIKRLQTGASPLVFETIALSDLTPVYGLRTKVILDLGGKLEEREFPHVMYQPEFNTFVLNTAYKVILPEDPKVLCAESFGRVGALMTIADVVFPKNGNKFVSTTHAGIMALMPR